MIEMAYDCEWGLSLPFFDAIIHLSLSFNDPFCTCLSLVPFSISIVLICLAIPYQRNPVVFIFADTEA